MAPGRIQPIGTDYQLAGTVSARLSGRRGPGARLRLGVGGYSVFQVQDYHVAGQRPRLLNCPGVAGRQVESAATRAAWGRHQGSGLHWLLGETLFLAFRMGR